MIEIARPSADPVETLEEIGIRYGRYAAVMILQASPDRLAQDLTVLARDIGVRLAGTPSERAAADYIIAAHALPVRTCGKSPSRCEPASSRRSSWKC